MKWEYNKKKPWLSGLSQPKGNVYVKHDPANPKPYWDGKEWTANIARARCYTAAEVKLEKGWETPTVRWLLIA